MKAQGRLLALAVLALYVEIAYGNGVPTALCTSWQRGGNASDVQSGLDDAATMVVVGVVYEVQARQDTFATTWSKIVPFPLIGIGMIAVSGLVVAVREL